MTGFSLQPFSIDRPDMGGSAPGPGAGDGWLMEDGTSFWLMEDGSSFWLMG